MSIYNYNPHLHRSTKVGYLNPEIQRDFVYATDRWLRTNLKIKGLINLVGAPSSGVVLSNALCLLKENYVAHSYKLLLSGIEEIPEGPIVFIDDYINRGDAFLHMFECVNGCGSRIDHVSVISVSDEIDLDDLLFERINGSLFAVKENLIHEPKPSQESLANSIGDLVINQPIE